MTREKRLSLVEMQRINTEVAQYGREVVAQDTRPRNLPGSTVKGIVYRNAFVADIETYNDVEIMLDEKGIHGTCTLDGQKVTLTRLNSRLDYSFDAPDTLFLYAVSELPYHVDASISIVAHSAIEACEIACTRANQSGHSFYTSDNFKARKR